MQPMPGPANTPEQQQERLCKLVSGALSIAKGNASVNPTAPTSAL